MSKQIKSTCLALFLCFFVSFVGYSQSSTATLSGTVQDENQAVIPGAAITIKNYATAFERRATTNESGSFTIPLLPPGEYTVLVEREGFTRVQLTNIVLNVGDQKAVQVQLKVGDVQSTVEVRADPSLIRTDGSVGTVVDREFVGNLPLNGRSFQSLILLTPGVVVTPSTNGGNPGQFSVNGQRSNANYFTVDGVSANNGVLDAGIGNVVGANQALAGVLPGVTAFGGTNSLVSVDALEEFRIQTSSYSAEFGRQPGGQISLITRSGTNQFHGTIFDYLRNDVFDANDWFANAAGKGKAPLRQNQFGGTFSGPVFFPNIGDGGPIWYQGRDRTFFFFSYEGLRLRLPQAVVTNVPSARLRQQAAASVRSVLQAFPVPTSPESLTNTPCPVPPAPPNPACDPATNRLFTGFSPFTGVYSDPSSLDAPSIRIDHTVNERLTLFGRYSNSPSTNSVRSTLGLSQISENKVTMQSVTIGATAVASRNLSNELRFNMSRNRSEPTIRLDDFGGAIPIDLGPAISPSFSSNEGNLLSILLVNLPSASASLRLGPADITDQRQINLVDNVSWQKGAHSLKFGIDYRRLAPIYTPASFQNVSFSTEAQVRSATVNFVQFSSRREVRPIITNISIYGHDGWKVSKRLTIDLGLRWEINPAPKEKSGEKPIGILGLDNVLTATLAPPDAPVYRTDYRALAPRIGMAYLLSDAKGWEHVVRGGFGVFYDTAGGQSTSSFLAFPFRSENTPRNILFPISPAEAVVPAPVVQLPITQSVRVQDPDLKLPYTLHWNISVEQSLGANQSLSASYVAAAGRRLLTTQLLNQSVGGRRPNSNFASIFLTSNGPSSDYHSLQLQFQRRLTRGLQALVNYTWSHAIDEASDEFSIGVFDRGNAAFDVRHNLSSAITYNLPGQRAKGLLGSLIRDWWIDGIVHAQSAAPVDIRAGAFNREDGTQVAVRPDLIVGVPLYLDDPTVAGGRRFNTAAFRPPSAGRQGTLGRNVLRGLPLYQVDLALRRQFNLTEKVNLQLKGEVFNIFNHPNFGGIATNLNNQDTFGVPSQMLSRGLGGLSALYQVGGPRSIQLSARIQF